MDSETVSLRSHTRSALGPRRLHCLYFTGPEGSECYAVLIESKQHGYVPGSHLTPSGGTGDGLGGRWTVPTASGARRDDLRCGKRDLCNGIDPIYVWYSNSQCNVLLKGRNGSGLNRVPTQVRHLTVWRTLNQMTLSGTGSFP